MLGDQIMVALEGSTRAISNYKDTILFTDNSINKTIKARTKILSPNQKASSKTVPSLRVATKRIKQRATRMVNNRILE